MANYNLSEKQIAALKVFRSGSLVSANQLADRLCIIRTNAQLRIDELRDKGLIRKSNATQFCISTKGLLALESFAEEQKKAAAEANEAAEAVEVETVEEYETVDEVEAKQVAEAEEVEAEPEEATQSVDAYVPVNQPNVFDAIRCLQDKLTKPQPIAIDRLEMKKEVLAELGRILDQSITDVLVEICDDLDRAAGNEV